ncbi:non-canonical purine NTP pyrophosphatase [Rhodococcus koreensis]
MEMTLITGNAGKAAEFEALLGFSIAHEKVRLAEIQAIDVAEVAKSKAQEAYVNLGKPVLVDDTGFSLTAWGGLPGALVSWFLDSVGNEGILRMAQGFSDRRVTVTTALGYADADGARVFLGSLQGTLADRERGDNGFGYDSIFIPGGGTRTFAEMSSDEKNAISMRRLAVDNLKSILGV